MRDTGVTPVYSNTWGDAICCVFDDVASAGNFALALQAEVRTTDWKALGMPEQVNLRIALHAGPVYRCFDSLLGRETFNGSHVNRAARIEPITEEGQIFASRSFAALSAAHQARGFVCDNAGTRDLPKKAGRLPVFLVRPATG